MKAFLEEYGFVILIAIVIILLIVMATPVGNSIKASILGLVDRFSGTATSKLDKADQGDFTVNLRQASDSSSVSVDVNSDSTTDKYKIIITRVKNGKKGSSTALSSDSNPGTYVNGDASYGTYVNFDVDDSAATNKQGNGTMTLTIKDLDTPDDGSELYVTVINEGTNEVVQSNSIKYHQ